MGRYFGEVLAFLTRAERGKALNPVEFSPVLNGQNGISYVAYAYSR